MVEVRQQRREGGREILEPAGLESRHEHPIVLAQRAGERSIQSAVPIFANLGWTLSYRHGVENRKVS